MSYIDYKSKDDLQDDTFKQIATLNWVSMVALTQKDSEQLVSTLFVIYVTCWKKMGKSLPKNFEQDLKQLEQDLYGTIDLTAEDKSKLFMRARELYKEVAGALSDSGLLFRATIDASEIGAREEL